MTQRVDASEEESANARPCRPYRIGEHSDWLRRRLFVSMVVAAVVAATASAAMVVGGATLFRDRMSPEVVGWLGAFAFAGGFLAGHWLSFGPRRWTALEPMIWSGRHAAAALAAETGISDPTDRDAARGWLDATPAADDEPMARTYWRAYCHLLVGDLATARSFAERLGPADGVYLPRASLMAQIALAAGEPFDTDGMRAIVEAAPESVDRAIAAAELGALGAQVAWTCGADDIAPVLAMRPYIGRRAAGTLLRHYWLPLLVVLGAISVGWQLL